MTISTSGTTLSALAEDIRTAWVPDALGLVDAPGLIDSDMSDADLGIVDSVTFPKPDGSTMAGAVFNLRAHGALHRSVEPFRDRVDAALDAGVCGYRRGAEIGYSYSTENVRFHEMTSAEAEHAEYVVFADIEQFFAHSSWDVVIDSVERIAEGDADLDPLRTFADAAQKSGFARLPAGYADARLLGNAVLSRVDEEIDRPFVRWVDDYRIFASSHNDALQVLSNLRASAARTGLSLNDAKVSIVPADSVTRGNGMPLESVYHPEIESPAQVRAALRTVFFDAVQSPQVNRRSIRFVLPRLAAQGDDIALDWVLENLTQMPWEAPRFCAYLDAFSDRAKVSLAVERALLGSLDARSSWLALRLSALACSTGVSKSSHAMIGAAAEGTESPALWSLLLRLLALSRSGERVGAMLASRVLDPRVAFAALRDLGEDGDLIASQVGSATIDALRDAPAPAPIVASIL